MGEIRTTVWCLGNPLRGDDGVAIRCGKMLLENSAPQLEVVLCETVPENFAAPLRRNPPERLVVLDACLMGSVPGTIRMLDSNCLDGLTETTHGLPLGEILKGILPADKIFVIGIEPRSTDFSLALSPEVEAAAQRLACALMDGSWTGIPRNSGL